MLDREKKVGEESFTFEDESGFANASGTVEDERLRYSVMLGMVV